MRNVERNFMLAVALACIAAPMTRAQDPCLNCVRDAQNGDAWCDDFEMNSGPNPQCYDTQACTAEPEIPMGCNGWRPWFDDPDVHAVVTCDQNHTEGGIQALAIDTNDDQVRVFEGYDLAASEFWALTTYIYIPSNMEGDAFWIVNPDYPNPGTTWAIVLRFSIADGICQACSADGACIGGLITNEWVELRAEINLAADKVRLFYDGQFLTQYRWNDPGGGGCGGGSSQIQALDLFSSGATRFYYDDTSLCPAEIPRFTTPTLQCRAIERLDSGCADYWWSLSNVNDFDDILEFYVDVETGDGGQICNGEEDMTPPPGWTVTLCSGYTNGHALFRLVNDDPEGNPFVPGRSVSGRLRVDPNGASPTVTDTGLEVPPFSALLHVAQVSEDGASNPDARCDGTFDWGPTTELPVACDTNDDCVDFGVDCVGGVCEGILRASKWSSPTDVCTAFLAVPAMTTWAKAALVTLLVAGGALLVLRSRVPSTMS